jgi:hypothetical protein
MFSTTLTLQATHVGNVIIYFLHGRILKVMIQVTSHGKVGGKVGKGQEEDF